MGSTRLPGKVLRPINGVPLLQHIIARLAHLRHETQTVVATSTAERDDVLAAFCGQQAVDCYRGSETNVLERYYLCARERGFRQIVRLTADNPFPDIEELDRLIVLHVSSGSDFSHSFGSLPIGVGAEIFTFDALEASFRDGHAPHHLEHVDEYLLEHPQRFRTSVLEVSDEKRYPEVRLTVDTEEDYRRACFVAEHATTPYVRTEEAVRLCMQFA